MDKLHVVFVFSNLTFPPREGLHVQSTALMRALRQKGHEISIITLTREYAQIDTDAFFTWLGGFRDLCIIPSPLNYPLLLTSHLVSAGRAKLVSTIHEMASVGDEPVLIHLEGIGMGPVLADLQDYPCVMSTVDAWSLRQKRLATQASGARRAFFRSYAALSARTERKYFPLAQAVHVVSEPDAVYLRQHGVNSNVVALPVALVDVPLPRSAPFNSPTPDQRPVVAFWGDIRVDHLRAGLEWLFDEIDPRLRRAGFNVIWRIYGRGEPDATLRAKAAAGTDFHSWVDDIDAQLRQADVVVLPDTSGTGLKNRAIHAMACGVPVVGTTHAFEGFPVADQQDASVQDLPDGFAAAIASLLNSPQAAQQMADRGRTFAINGYSMASLVSRWEGLYAQALLSHRKK